MKNIQNTFYLILFFLLTTSQTIANTANPTIGGWTINNRVVSGIGQAITATKSVLINGKEVVKTSTAVITPKATNVAKFLAKNAAAAVVISAFDMLLDGVDYVLDPNNNTLTYKKNDPMNVPYFWRFNNVNYSSLEAACIANSGSWKYSHSVYSGGTSAACWAFPSWGGAAIHNGNVNRVVNPSYNEDDATPKTVPLTTIASQVLDQAEDDIRAGNPASPAVALSRAVAQDMISEAETDDVKARPIATELNANSSIPTVEDGTGSISNPAVVDPVTGEIVQPASESSIAFQFPKACEWFPQACVFIDWMMQEPETDEGPDLPKEELEAKDIDEELITISSSSCPAPYPVTIELPVFNTTYNDQIDISPYCPDIEKLAPVLQLIAFVMAVMIIKDI